MKKRARYTGETDKILAEIRRHLTHKGLGTNGHAVKYSDGTYRIITYNTMSVFKFKLAVAKVIEECDFGDIDNPLFIRRTYRSEVRRDIYAGWETPFRSRTCILTIEP